MYNWNKVTERRNEILKDFAVQKNNLFSSDMPMLGIAQLIEMRSMELSDMLADKMNLDDADQESVKFFSMYLIGAMLGSNRLDKNGNLSDMFMSAYNLLGTTDRDTLAESANAFLGGIAQNMIDFTMDYKTYQQATRSVRLTHMDKIFNSLINGISTGLAISTTNRISIEEQSMIGGWFSQYLMYINQVFESVTNNK